MSYSSRLNLNYADLSGESTAGDLGNQTFAGEERTRVDKDLAGWYNPHLERTMREIMREIQVMRLAGKLRPFVEGEPIGAYVPRVVVQYTEPPEARWNRRQQELRDLRAANEARLDQLERYL